MSGSHPLKGKLDSKLQDATISSADNLIQIISGDVELTEQELNQVSGGRSKQSEAKANMKAQY